MRELRDKMLKRMDILSEIILTYMLFVLFEISVAFMIDEPKTFPRVCGGDPKPI